MAEQSNKTRHKSHIMKIGSVDENGHCEGWAFFGGEIGVEISLETGEQWLGGYSPDELREIAKNKIATLPVK